MKTISSGLATHLAGTTTTTAKLWKITRQDGESFHFTDHDQNLEFEGDVYEASTGFTSSDLETTAQMNVDSLEVRTFFDSAYITEVDVAAGKWDRATISLALVNYANLSQGALLMRYGELGQFSYSDGRFVAELRGLMQAFANSIVSTYGPNCPYRLGDDRCKVTLDGTGGVTQAFVITAVASRIEMTIDVTEADNYFRYGIVRFTTGLNAGYGMEVRESDSSGVVALQLQMPFEIQVGDEGEIVAGCDKTEATCISKFDNVINFGGFADIPGIDKQLNSL